MQIIMNARPMKMAKTANGPAAFLDAVFTSSRPFGSLSSLDEVISSFRCKIDAALPLSSFELAAVGKRAGSEVLLRAG